MPLTDKEPWEIVPAASTGFVQVSVLASSTLGTIPQGATGATINVEAAAADIGGARVLRYRLDGTAPTTTVGAIAGDGAQINLINQSQLQNFKAISMTAETQILNVQFFYNTLTS